MAVRIFISHFDDPFVNLALEASLLSLWNPGEHWLYLWCNRPCVVLGRFQNPWLECRTGTIAKKNIPLVRRTSGGGTVYHDYGNLCFSFFNSRWDKSKEDNLHFLTTSLNRLGIPALSNSRQDLICYKNNLPHKISGSAFKQKRDRAIHHGTLLVNANLENLKEYLCPPQKIFSTKALPSTPSPVTNLASFQKHLNVSKVTNLLAESFLKHPSGLGKVVPVDHKFIKNHGLLYKKEYDKLTNPTWIYGETPDFTHSLNNIFSWGPLKVTVEVHRGFIRKGRFQNGDGSEFPMGQSLSRSLEKKEYSPEGIEQARRELPPHPRLTEICRRLAGSLA